MLRKSPCPHAAAGFRGLPVKRGEQCMRQRGTEDHGGALQEAQIVDGVAVPRRKRPFRKKGPAGSAQGMYKTGRQAEDTEDDGAA